MNFKKFLMGMMLLMDKAGEGSGGGGGGSGAAGGAGDGKGGSGDGKGAGGEGSGSTVTLTKEQFDAIMARLPKSEGPGGGSGGSGGQGDGDPTLADKARKQREEDERKAGDSRAMENALKFTMGGKDWLKTNSSLLPKTVEGIFDQAEKENYGSAVAKASAIKVGIISEFFAQQSNLDLLTPGLKSQLEEFLKLTKTVKEERAAQVFDTVFEPAFEMLKRVKRAEERGKGHSTPSDADAAYKEKLMKGSRKHYLGEKNA